MPTVMTHAVVPLAIGLALGRRRVPSPLLVAGVAAAMLPDADVIAFRLGIPYADAFGHRGASHALFSAACVGLLGALVARWLKTTSVVAFAFLFVAVASHGVFDMLTDGGLGVALLWPWSDERFFAAARPIAVSPIGREFLSERGLAVLGSELLWVWLPCLLLAFALRRAIYCRSRR